MKSQPFLHVALLIIFSLSIYINTLKNGFVYDDGQTIVSNIMIRNLDNLPQLFKKDYSLRAGEKSYRPVVTFSYFLDYAFFNLTPWGFHLTNILLHAANGALFYFFLLFLIGKPLKVGLSISTSLLFISHPVLSESVNVISFREELLVFFFYIATLHLYFSIKSTSLQPSAIKARYFLSCLTYFLALFSKEMAITLPIIIYCYELIYTDKKSGYWFLNPINRYSVGYIVVTLVYIFFRFFYYHNPNGDESTFGGIHERLLTIPWLLQSYLKLFLFPISLSADYSIMPVVSFFSQSFIIPVIVLMSFFLFSLKKYNKNIIFGLLFFLVTLIPVYNIVSIHNPLAERYLYLPCAGLAIVVGSLIPYVIDTRRSFSILPLAIILIIFSISIVKRNTIWESEHSLWTDTVKKMPHSSRAHTNLGVAYQKEGDAEAAIYQQQVALKLNPDYPSAHNNIGLAYRMTGRFTEALEEFKTAIRLRPDSARYYNNLGDVYVDLSSYKEAIRSYQSAIALNPYHPSAHFNLGTAYQKAGYHDEAMQEYEIAIKFDPNYQTALQGISLMMYDNLSGFVSNRQPR